MIETIVAKNRENIASALWRKKGNLLAGDSVSASIAGIQRKYRRFTAGIRQSRRSYASPIHSAICG